MNYNTQRLTLLVNNNINQRRRAIGKGSRETHYRSICKNLHHEIDSAILSISRHRVGHTYGEVWNINTSKKAYAKNRHGLLQLAHILASKSDSIPAISVVADFITFVMIDHNDSSFTYTYTSTPSHSHTPTPTPTVPADATATPTPTLPATDNASYNILPNYGNHDWESFAQSL